MNRQIIYIALFLFLMISCKPSKKDTEILDIINSPEQEDVTISSIGITLSAVAKQKTETWLEYQMIASKIKGYNKTTKSQALENALELANLIKNASDTIDIKKLDRPDVKIRFNVLYNHALRLDDMSTIPSISKEEVKTEVTSILDAFSAVNEKINLIYKIEAYEKEFDIVSNETEIETIEELKKSEIKPVLNKKGYRNPKIGKKKAKIPINKKEAKEKMLLQIKNTKEINIKK